ncbi:hypothetical protein ACOME3_009606 [Neoechinorhynchus agilis]
MCVSMETGDLKHNYVDPIMIQTKEVIETYESRLCAICQEDRPICVTLVSSKCRHVGCGPCLIKWICQNSLGILATTCPLCRARLFEDCNCLLVYFDGSTIDGMSVEVFRLIRKTIKSQDNSRKVLLVKRALYVRSIYVSRIEDPNNPSRGSRQRSRSLTPNSFSRELLHS